MRALRDCCHLVRAGGGVEGRAVQPSGECCVSSPNLRVSCLDRLSLIVQGLDTKTAPGSDVTGHVTGDKIATGAGARPTQTANCWAGLTS